MTSRRADDKRQLCEVPLHKQIYGILTRHNKTGFYNSSKGKTHSTSALVTRKLITDSFNEPSDETIVNVTALATATW